MPTLLIRHKVVDFAVWKATFDNLVSVRQAFGCQAVRLFRDVSDPSEVLLLMTWDDHDRARLFAQSDELLEAMRRSGVIDEPDWWVLDEVDLPSA